MTSHNKWLIAKRDVGAERVQSAASFAWVILQCNEFYKRPNRIITHKLLQLI